MIQYDEPFAGPLIAAFVDNLVSVTLDANGNALRDSVEVTRPPDAASAADLRLVEPINRGADRAEFVALGAPMIEPAHEREDRPERWTEDFTRALMRHRVGGTEGPLSGGSSGGRRMSKKPTVVRLSRREESDHSERDQIPRLRVSGLTVPEREYFTRRPGLARSVLRDLIGEIIRNKSYEPRSKVERLEFAFVVYGLNDLELQILRNHRAAVRTALADHVKRADPPAIRWARRTLER